MPAALGTFTTKSAHPPQRQRLPRHALSIGVAAGLHDAINGINSDWTSRDGSRPTHKLRPLKPGPA
jgi:hypothetical protein